MGVACRPWATGVICGWVIFYTWLFHPLSYSSRSLPYVTLWCQYIMWLCHTEFVMILLYAVPLVPYPVVTVHTVALP